MEGVPIGITSVFVSSLFHELAMILVYKGDADYKRNEDVVIVIFMWDCRIIFSREMYVFKSYDFFRSPCVFKNS